MKKDSSMVNAYAAGTGHVSATAQQLIDRREKALGQAYRLFYREPVHVVRGEGVWLYDPDGNAYLDAYNNVASLGHCHPRVVEAMHQQAATLSTHTRYLNDPVVDYAEALLSRFPLELSTVMFTCSGSEANDLALRIAKLNTGGTGVIVTENAYHGVTQIMSGCSPSLGAGAPLGEDVWVVPSPISPSAGDAATVFCDGVREALSSMKSSGVAPAALLVDTVFSSDGLYVDPAGFLEPAVQAVRDAGGLVIADEVQAGFARTGDAFWGFERHGLLPDIVTMGKPMGNGYPMAGLAAKGDLARRFGESVRYFNTFGGNSVAAATGLAVLDVIRDEGLLENARDVGAYFAQGLGEIANSSAVIGDVRSAGLYLSVDIVRKDGPSVLWPGGALELVNGLRRDRILISATGKTGGTLKIRPPLIFTRDHVDYFLDHFAKQVGGLSDQAGL